MTRRLGINDTVSFKTRSANRKLGPRRLDTVGNRKRPVPVGPFVCSTYTSIQKTCSNACPWKNNGCYPQSGFTKSLIHTLDEAARDFTPDEVVAEEARRICRAFHGWRIPQDGGRHGQDGRDLRLHDSGDVTTAEQASLLAATADDWIRRGGGVPWTYTHAWRQIPRKSFGKISVLASVETPEDIERARSLGYASAIVVDKFPSKRAFRLPGSSATIIPCPAEKSGRTCVQCRLCLDADGLLRRNEAIAFQAHGPDKKRVADGLVQLRVPSGGGRRG
jgi:hypothetical protein